jgi:cation transport ATPase
MKTVVVEVGGLLSALSAEGVRKQLQKLSGVHHAEVNYVAPSATVHYAEEQVSLDDIRRRIVYLLNSHAGHLGIFGAAAVAKLENQVRDQTPQREVATLHGA